MGGRRGRNRSSDRRTGASSIPEDRGDWPSDFSDNNWPSASHAPQSAPGAYTPGAYHQGASLTSQQSAAHATSGGSADVDGNWHCPTCTFENNAALNECEMCGTARPGVASTAPSAPARSGGGGSDPLSDKVKRLVEMGFPEDKVRQALESTGGDAELA